MASFILFPVSQVHKLKLLTEKLYTLFFRQNVLKLVYWLMFLSQGNAARLLYSIICTFRIIFKISQTLIHCERPPINLRKYVVSLLWHVLELKCQISFNVFKFLNHTGNADTFEGVNGIMCKNMLGRRTLVELLEFCEFLKELFYRWWGNDAVAI